MSTLSILSTFGTATSTYTVKEVRTSRVFVDHADDKLSLESVNSAADALKLSTSNAASGITASTGSSGFALTTLGSAAGATGGLNFSSGAATTAAASGAISLSTGNSETGSAGGINISAGDSTSSGIGGAIVVSAGSSTTGTAGNLTLVAGFSGGSVAAGNTSLSAGNNTSNGAGGNLSLAAGDSTTGTAGNVSLTAGTKGLTDGGAVSIISKRAADAPGLSSMLLQTLNADNTMRLESTTSTRDNTAANLPNGRWAIELEALLGGINIKAKQGLNARSDNGPLNLSSGGAASLTAVGNTSIQSTAGTLTASSQGNMSLSSTTGSLTATSGGNMSLTSSGTLSASGTSTTISSTSATGDITLNSAQNVSINANSGAGIITLNGSVSLSGASSNMNVPGDLNVVGNITVGGSMTYLNTQTLNVEDNIIVVNLQSAKAVQANKPDGGLVMYKYPGDYIAGAAIEYGIGAGSTTGATTETPSRDTVTIPDASGTAPLNLFKGMVIRQGANWAIIDESTASSGGVVTLTLGGHSAIAPTYTGAFDICNPQTVGVVYKENVHVASKIGVNFVDANAEGGMICAQSNSDPGDSLTISEYTNSLCKSLVVGAGTDTGDLYFGQAKVADGQWRIRSNTDGTLKIEKWVSGAWQTKAIWA